MKEKHDEKWLLGKGWKKIEGYMLNHEMINTDWEHSFWPLDSFKDIAKKCTYYQNEDINDEFATDDLQECIDLQEEREKQGWCD